METGLNFMQNISLEQFKKALNYIASTEEGQIVLAAIKETCHWDTIVLDSENPAVSHYYAVRRGLYAGLRKHINVEHLKKIEFHYQLKAEQLNDGTTNERNSGDRSGSGIRSYNRRNAK